MSRKHTTLVVNEAAVAEVISNQLCNRVSNVATVKVRKETLNGRDYLAIPTVMLAEGVIPGSRGPLFYPGEEMSKAPETWNMKPVVKGHPKRGSATSKEVLNSTQIGMVMNTTWDATSKTLRCEAWIEESLCKKVDMRIWNAIQKKQTMEQSTGLYTDTEVEDGEYNGEKYSGIARNHRPDHLAILPDETGAFSVAKGGGFIRNELTSLFPNMDKEDVEIVRDLLINTITREMEGKKNGKTGMIASILLENEASHEEVRTLLYKALAEKFPQPEGDKPGYGYCYIEGVYDDNVIYSLSGKLYSIGYTKSDAGVKLGSTPSEVVRFAEYRTKAGTSVVNSSSTVQPKDKGNTMNKKQMIDELISNHGHSEESREMLTALPDNALAAIHSAAVAVKNGDGKGCSTSEKDMKKGKKKVMEKNSADDESDDEGTQNAELTEEEYIAKAPKGVREVLQNQRSVYNAEKTKLIETIVANKSNEFPKAELMEMPLNQLQRLARLAATETTKNVKGDFSGMGRFEDPTPVANVKAEDALVMPKIEFTLNRK